MSIKGLWLLSYNFCPETVDLYSKPGLYIEKLERPNNMAQKYDPGSMYEEILVSNFDTSKTLPLQMSLSGDVPEERNFMMEKRLTALWSVNFAVKALRILGKRGRVTVPQEVRDEIGWERGDVVSFAVVDADSVLVKRERLYDNCVAESNQTDMMKLLVQAMHFAKPGESAQDAFEFLTGLPLHQRFDMRKRLCSQSSHNFRRIIADWAEKIHEK